MHLFCDESGNTGTNLLDPQQPVFALAVTRIDTESAWKLITPLLSKGQSEAKYSSLRRTSSGQAALIRLFSSTQLSRETAFFVMAQKRFYLATQLVDKIIEPPMYEAGIDLYARNAAVNLSNVWHYAGPYVFPDGGWDKILVALQSALQQRNDSAFERFDATVRLEANNANPEMRDLVVGLLMAQGRLPQFLGVFSEAASFDPAVDCFIMAISDEMQRHSGRFDVTHDISKPLARQAPLLRALMDPAASTTTIGYGKRKMELPLRIAHLDFADSHKHPQLQVADLIAGCAVDCALAFSGRRAMTAFHERVADTGFNALFAGGLLPNPEIRAAPEPAEGESSLVDGAADFLRNTSYFHHWSR